MQVTKEDLKIIKEVAEQKFMHWHISQHDVDKFKEAVARINKLAEDVR